MGDFNGISPELILKTFTNELIFNYCTPVIYGVPFVFKHYAQLLDFSIPFFNFVQKKEDIKPGVLNMRVCSDERVEITPGTPSEQAGKVAFQALEMVVDDIKNGWIDGLLTAPLDKETAAKGGLNFNGHTEYLAECFESSSLMILMDESLRVAMVTGHTSLGEVSKSLTKDKITTKIHHAVESLKADFGIVRPKIAILGLNPHLGDGGLMGNEENDLIKPAIEAAQKDDILVYGPYSPDGYFGSDAVSKFDMVIGMYHDQVLIPFKQKSFNSGVNYTAGLPIVRTSPDHGVAYDIAGKGVADNESFINALYTINKIDRNRLNNFENSKNPLSYAEHRREKFSIGVPNIK